MSPSSPLASPAPLPSASPDARHSFETRYEGQPVKKDRIKNDVFRDEVFKDEVTKRHHRAPESGTMPCLDPWAIPSLLRGETLFRLSELFEEELGSEFECHRIIAALSASRGTVPRRLAGPLLVALSQKLHPERRTGFLRDACGVLHDYEGTPRVLL